eukprot:CAMPEP_0184306820 /NCGR_PEP_ID=MMETSP1049-20130417/15715_1 /TAXON_ID=77928 /ORGANISM="Proteomonas sulcata, Strain CCMP704" /LENGTH=371 /DNA_ID=CAMNT_0026619165 /DNA_START=258 /DNA_END=1374 /DNA_ORIENTATION=-
MESLADFHSERELAFAMGLHDRLGRSSTAAALRSDELCNLIAHKSKKPMMFVVGGKNPTTNESIAGVEAFEPETKKWYTTSNMVDHHPCQSGLYHIDLNHCVNLALSEEGSRGGGYRQQLYVLGGQHSGKYTSPTGKAPLYCRYHANAMVQSTSDRYGDWRDEEPMPTARSYLAATALEGKIYALGGFEGTLGNRYLATVETYDPETRHWATCAELPFERSHLAAASTGGKLLALGGYCSGSTTSAVDRYDPTADKWAQEKSMPTARDSLAAVECSGKIFALGGCCDGSVVNLKIVESFDLRSGKWTMEASMPCTRALLGATSLNDKIYVCGGSQAYDCGRAVHSFDPRNGQWIEESEMAGPRIGVALAVV